MLNKLMSAVSAVLYRNSYTLEEGRFESFILGIKSDALLGPVRGSAAR